MKCYWLLFLCLCWLSSPTWAQIRVNSDDALLAEQLQSRFPQKKIVALSVAQQYEFTVAKDAQHPVSATESFAEQVISLKDFNKFEKGIFYDEMSNVSSLIARDARNRTVRLTPLRTNYQSNGIFHDDVKVCYINQALETRGEKLSLAYEKQYQDVRYLTRVFFHANYPILERDIVFTVPNEIEVELVELNFDTYDIEKSVKDTPQGKEYRYTVRNLSAFQHALGAPALAKRYPHLLVICKRYEKNGALHNFLSSTEDLYRWYASLTAQVHNDPASFKPLVQQLIQDKSTDEEKIEAIFYWVQDNIRYIAFEDGIMGFKPDAAQNVFENRYGDCKGMANLTKGMLRIAGYDARLTWLGTRDIPYDYNTPSLAVDNHMICTLLLNDKKYFLDPTEKFIALSDYAYRIQDRPVLIENGTNFLLEKIPTAGKERDRIVQETAVRLEEDVLLGHTKTIYHGEEKTRLLRGYHTTQTNDREKALIRYLVQDNRNITCTNVSTSDFTDRSSPLELSYDFAWKNNAFSVGNELYLSIDQEKEFGQLVFEEDRQCDFEFPNKVFLEHTTVLELPSTWQIQHLPKDIAAVHSTFSFEVAYRQEGKKIYYTKRISIDEGVIKQADFKTWNSTLKQVQDTYNDQIILVKK